MGSFPEMYNDPLFLAVLVSLGPFIRGKIRRVLHRTRLKINKTRTYRINGTFRLK